MLARLYIRNFALIGEAELEFGPGFNVITGETGAGKSILIGALNCILGQRADSDTVRQGADACVVEALFEFDDADPAPAALADLGAAPEDGQLVVRRQIQASGRSRAQVNGLSVPARQLRQIGAQLIDLHGQHQHQSLLDPAQHAFFLDAYGDLHALAADTARLHRDASGAARELAQLEEEKKRLADEEELRRFQLEEIRALEPRPGEEEELESDLLLLENFDELGRTARELNEALYQAEGSIAEKLAQARRRLERAAEVDPQLLLKAETLANLVYSVEDLAGSLRDYSDRLDADPERLERARERLDELRRLRHKHDGSIEEVLALAAELEKQENRSGTLDKEICRLHRRHRDLLDAFGRSCLKLSAGRARAAERLCHAVEDELEAVGMAQASFGVDLPRREDKAGPVEDGGRRWHADAGGLERVEFRITANSGQPPRPLARIASGGEISRVMLALKTLIADRRTVPTLVFDEIDVGISGRVAAAVGKRLDGLSRDHQTVIVTHLPQIASAARRHFAVRKEEDSGATQTRVFLLDEDSRAEEIANLLAGETVSDTARRHAREMLD